ncbi:VCBS domain-containing protein [Vibrio rhizosphaerae]|uniref:VCBS domain-containing protein n=2 Tax=Vibrio rhizosphaerae TaxID=398736 RepID=UPI0021C46530|nr:VCBS domain-containing protein [Vibrio rhizosphaerae]
MFANTTVTGTYGSLTLVDGQWTYTLDQSKVQSLNADEQVKDTITLTASDGTTQDIVIDITGTDDAPVVSGTLTGAVTEGDVGDVTQVSGTIAIRDVDSNDNPEFADTTVTGTYGSLTLIDGQWTYTLDQSKVQSLNADEQVKDTITLTASDGTTQDIVIDITGTDDAPVVSGTLTGAVTEGDVGDVTQVSGTIAIRDVDSNDNPEFADTTATGTYGSLTLVDGQWTYTLDQSKVQSLNADEQVKDTITLTASDGTTQAIVIDITGTDDAPVVSGTLTGAVTEGDVGDVTQVSGTIAIRDADAGDNPEFADTTATGTYGSLTLVDGQWTYTLDQSKVQSLNADEQVKDTITLTASDGTTQDIVIDITGTDDAPVVSGSFTGAVTEGDVGDVTQVSGTIAIRDVDSNDNPVFANTTVTGAYGSLTLVDGQWTYTLDQSKVQSLAQNEQVKDTITLTASDGTTQDIVIDISGTNDAPVAQAATASVTQDQTITGSITATDVDLPADKTLTFSTGSTVTGLTLNADGTYSFDASGYDALGEGETQVIKVPVTVTDDLGASVTTTLTITVTGTDDAPVVSGTLTGAVTEGDVGDVTQVSGTIAIRDVDSNDNPVFANTTATGTYGSLTLVDGQWTYTLDQSKVQSLNADEQVKDTITLTASDGTTQAIVIDITGTDDAPVVSGTLTGAVTEGDVGDVTQVSGTIAIRDVDSNDNPEFADTTATGAYGSLTLVDGQWTYTLDQSKVQSLNADEQVKDTITLTASDGTTQDIVIDITGTDDAPVVSGTLTGAVTEGDVGDVTQVSGTIAIRDVDSNDNPVFANTTVTGAYGSLTLVDGQWTYTLDQSKVQSLAQNEQVKDTITLTASDGTTQDIVIDISGTNDAPVAQAATASVTQDQTITGSITATDVDLPADKTLTFSTGSTVTGLTLNADGTYSFDASGYDALGEGETQVIKVPVTVTDDLGASVTTTLTITVTGTDDAPVVSGTLTGAVTEGDVGDVTQVSGTIAIRDADAGDNPEFADTTATGTYGSLTLVDGQWTYTLDQSKVQSLNADEQVKDTITLTASDGTTQDIVIDITGTDDAPVVTGSFTGAVTEGDVGDVTQVSGTIAIRDVDSNDNPEFADTTVTGTYGSLTLVDGQWTYTLDQSKVQSLNADEQVKDTITLTASDGTTQDIVIDITGTDDAPVVSGTLTGAVTEGDLGDVTQVSGTIAIHDADAGDNPVFANTTATGTYGSLTLVDGQWTYTLDQSKVQSLNADEQVKDTITLTASDGTTQDIVIDITGTDDAPVVSGTLTGAVTEGDVGDVTQVSGTIAIRDVDSNDNPEFADTTATGAYGSLTLVDGQWTYTLDQSKVQSLNADEQVKDTITLTASDGTTQAIVIDITGTDDAPVVSGTLTGAVTEGDVGDVTQVSGTIAIRDVDSNDNPEFADTTVTGTYGSLTLVDGQWTYTLDQSKVQSLNADEQVKDTITLTASDGTTQDIVIDITGTDDAPVVTGSFTGAVTEGDVGDVTQVSGTIAIRDVDSNDNPVFADTTVTGTYGSLTLVDGQWTYTLDQSKVQSLNADEQVKDTITLTASDGTTQDIVIDITGTDDAPVVSGTLTGAVTEGDVGDVTQVSGTIAIRDADAGDNPEFADTTATGTYGSLTLVDGQWTYTLDQSKVQSLNADEQVKDTITLTASDGTTQAIVIDITGTDDAPVVSGTLTGAVTEGDVGDVTQVSGTIAIRDVDSNDNPVFANTTATGTYGSLTLVDGQWTYTLDQSKVQSLNADEQVKDTITLTASDGTTQDIVIDITGTDDAPVVSGTLTGAVTEGDVGDVTQVSGTIAIRDVDSNDNPEFADTTVTGTYGSLTLVDGQWTYTLDQSKVQSLNADEQVKDTITLTASDGTTQDIVIDITGTDDAPVVTGSFTGAVTEGDVGDVTQVSGTIAIRDVDSNDNPEFADTTATGAYGSLTLVDGQWTYTLDQSKVQSLNADEQVKDTITLTASDGTTQDIVIDITGTDDAPVVTGSFTGAVTEGDVGDVTQVSGTIAIRDVDSNDNPEFADTTVTGTYGSLTLVDGQWTYTLDQSKVQSLNADEQVKDTITLTASDGTTQDIVIDITGTNDAPVAQAATAAVTQDQTITGSITATDVDLPADKTLTFSTGSTVTGLTLNADGTYSFDASGYDALGEGETQVIKVPVTVTDDQGASGTTTLTITVTGTDDAPVVSGTFTGAVSEGDAGDVTQVSGTIAIRDADAGDNPEFADTTATGTYGSLTLVDGQWTYTLDQSKVQSLNADEQVKDTIMLTASDGTTQAIVIDITGTDDAPVVSGTLTGAVTEGDVGDVTQISGTIAIRDVDSNDNPVFADTTATGTYGSLTLVDGQWTYTLDQSKVQSLNADEQVKDTITLTASDGTTQDIVIDITGTDDAPVVSGTFTGAVTEGDVGDVTQVSGTIAIRDADAGDNPVFANTTVTGTYGSLTLVDGQWTYTLDQSKVQSLNADEQVKDTITLTASDGTTQDIVIDITGTDDAPVVSGTLTGAVTEGDVGDVTQVSGTIAIRDADAGDNPEFADTTVTGAYGSLTLVDGQWTYTLDQSKVQSLAQNEQVKDTITLTASDGTTQDIVIDITGTNDAPTLTLEDSAKQVSVSEEGLPQGNPDSTGSSDTTNSKQVSGSFSVSDPDSSSVTLSLVAPTTSLYSHGIAIIWTLLADGSLVGQANGETVMTISLSDEGNGHYSYTVDLQGPVDHPDPTTEDTLQVDFGIAASDGQAVSTEMVRVSIEDDSPDSHSTNIVVDTETPLSFSVSGTAVSLGNSVFDNGNWHTYQSDTKVVWGTSGPWDSSYSSYQVSSAQQGAHDYSEGKPFELATLVHHNGSVWSDESTLHSTVLTIVAQIVINGVTQAVTLNLNINHDETSNNSSSDGDSITLTTDYVDVEIDGVMYRVDIEGFKKEDGSISKTVVTPEGETDSYTVVASLNYHPDSHPDSTVTGTVDYDAGADGMASVTWQDGTEHNGVTVIHGDYGTLTVYADGHYTYDANEDALAALDKGTTATDSFNYVVTDNDGDSATSSLNFEVSGQATPSVSTGLHGEFYNYQEGWANHWNNVDSLADALAIIQNQDPNAEFTSTKVDYRSDLFAHDLGGYDAAYWLNGRTNLEEWLERTGDDSSVVFTDKENSSDAVVRLTGAVALDSGTYSIKVTADDGYQIKIDGVVVAAYDGIQSATTDTFTFTVDGSGYQTVEIVYWDQGGAHQLTVALADVTNGVTGDYSILGSDAYPTVNGDVTPTGSVDVITDHEAMAASYADRIAQFEAGSYWQTDGDHKDNHLVGSHDNDHIDGHGGNDWIEGGSGGADWLQGGHGDDTLVSSYGSEGDLLDGGDNDDHLYGGDGNDILIGGSGADYLSGGAGNDILIGGSRDGHHADGSDLLIGGAGKDLFVLDSSSVDKIQDFHSGEDAIDLSNLLADALDNQNNDAIQQYLDQHVEVTSEHGQTHLSINNVNVADFGHDSTFNASSTIAVIINDHEFSVKYHG